MRNSGAFPCCRFYTCKNVGNQFLNFYIFLYFVEREGNSCKKTIHIFFIAVWYVSVFVFDIFLKHETEAGQDKTGVKTRNNLFLYNVVGGGGEFCHSFPSVLSVKYLHKGDNHSFVCRM